MTHAQIRAFHYVALLGGFSAAADALGITQPAISDQVRKLEQDNDVLLFQRTRRRVSLTPDGEALFARTRAYFEIEGDIAGQLSATANRIEKELRIMVDAASHVSQPLQRFQQTFPSVRITVLTGNTDEICDRLRAFEADIGVVGSDDALDGFEMSPLSVSRLVAFARKGRFPKHKMSLSLEYLSSLPLVLREEGSRTRQILEDCARARNVSLEPAIIAEGRETMREIVATSDCVGVISEAELGGDPRLSALRLEGISLEMNESIIHLRQRRGVRVIREFMKICRRDVANAESPLV